MANHWSDLNVDGRRLEGIIKMMNTWIQKADDNDPMKLAYIDRLIKATNTKCNIAEIVLGIKDIIKDQKKTQVVIDPEISR